MLLNSFGRFSKVSLIYCAIFAITFTCNSIAFAGKQILTKQEKRSFYSSVFKHFFEVDLNIRSQDEGDFPIETSIDLLRRTEDLLKADNQNVAYNLLKSKFDVMKETFEKLKRNHRVTFESMNLLAFQVTFLLDELEKGRKFGRILTDLEFEKAFENYFQEGLGTTLKAIRQTNWEDQDQLREVLTNPIGYLPSFSGLFPSQVGNFPVRVVGGFFGIIDLPSINMSFAKRQYWIGINSGTEYADGRLLSPLEFFHHDLTHYQNREVYLADVSNIEVLFQREQLFLEYLDESLANGTLDRETYERIQGAFFLKVHEEIRGELAFGFEKPSTGDFRYNFSSPSMSPERFYPGVHDLESLLPASLRTFNVSAVVSHLTERGIELELHWKKYFSAARSGQQPLITFDRNTLNRIIADFNLASSQSDIIFEALNEIENHINTIKDNQGEQYPEDFYAASYYKIQQIKKLTYQLQGAIEPSCGKSVEQLTKFIINSVKDLETYLRSNCTFFLKMA